MTETTINAIKIALGVFLILIGIPMLVLPGPGLLAIFAGLYLIVTTIPGGKERVERLRRKYVEWRKNRG